MSLNLEVNKQTEFSTLFQVQAGKLLMPFTGHCLTDKMQTTQSPRFSS
jgi:hypothetical protein